MIGLKNLIVKICVNLEKGDYDEFRIVVETDMYIVFCCYHTLILICGVFLLRRDRQ